MQLRDLLTSLQQTGATDRVEKVAEDRSVETLSLVTFRIGKREYAIDIDEASEIIRVGKVSIVPNSPPWVRGVCNLRGDLVPLVDLSLRFESRETDRSVSKLIGQTAIVARAEDTVFGLLIDEMKKTLTVPTDAVSASPSLVQSLGKNYVRGVVRREEAGEGGLLLILNLVAISSHDE